MSDVRATLGPAARYKHQHPPVTNVNDVDDGQLTRGQRIADKVATVVGGWPFIICQSCLLVVWMAANVYLVIHFHDEKKAFDPYPFILLNLVLSFQAAYTGPIVMMSQNRQNEKDRLMAQHDYDCNKTAEEEIRVLMEHLAHQDELMADIRSRLVSLQSSLPTAIAQAASPVSTSVDAAAFSAGTVTQR